MSRLANLNEAELHREPQSPWVANVTAVSLGRSWLGTNPGALLTASPTGDTKAPAASLYLYRETKTKRFVLLAGGRFFPWPQSSSWAHSSRYHGANSVRQAVVKDNEVGATEASASPAPFRSGKTSIVSVPVSTWLAIVWCATLTWSSINNQTQC